MAISYVCVGTWTYADLKNINVMWKKFLDFVRLQNKTMTRRRKVRVMVYFTVEIMMGWGPWVSKSEWIDHHLRSFVACVKSSPELSMVAGTRHWTRIAHLWGEHDTIAPAWPDFSIHYPHYFSTTGGLRRYVWLASLCVHKMYKNAFHQIK